MHRQPGGACAAGPWAHAPTGPESIQVRGQPEEREDPLGVQEERDLADAVLPQLEDLERPRVVAAARLARLVLTEGDLAVCVLHRQEPRAAAPNARSEPPGEDVV